MEDSASLQQIQSEVDIIKSMYGGEVEDLRKKDVSFSEQQYHTTSVRLCLTPLQSHSEKQPDCHVMCIIKVDTDNEYPNSPAKFTIEDYKGITVQEKDEIKTLLTNITQEAAKQGIPAFYNICSDIKDYLLQHYRPEEKCVYDAMLARQHMEEQQRAEAAAEERQRQKELQQQRGRKMEEEHEMYLHDVRAERKNAAQSRDRADAVMRSVSEAEAGVLRQSGSPAKTRSSRSFSEVQYYGENFIALLCSGKQEKVVEVGELLAQSEDKHRTTHKVLDHSTRSESVLHTWKVQIEQPERRKLTEHAKVREKARLEGLQAKLTSIEKEMPSLLKLSSDSVVEYEAYKILREPNKITIYLLQPYLTEKSLSHFLIGKINLNESYLKHIARGCLLSLVYLHQHGIVHRDLKDSNIYTDSNRTPVFRIADYSVERQIWEAVLGYHFMEAPHVYPRPTGRNKLKRDVFRLGIILISLAKGRRNDKIDPDIPRVFSSEFRDFFKQCLDPNEATRCSAANLLEHSVFAEHPSCGLDDPMDEEAGDGSKSDQYKKRRESCVPRLAAEGDNPDEAKAVLRTSTSEDCVPDNSRFNKDYDRLNEIGRGGFGKVYKVRNRVDGQHYAVKRIGLHQQSADSANRILREVQCLSILCHEHVVRYYTSWIDVTQQTDGGSSDSEDEVDGSRVGEKSGTTKSQEIYTSVSFNNDMDFTDDDSDEEKSSGDSAVLSIDNEDDSDFIVFEAATQDKDALLQDKSISKSKKKGDTRSVKFKENRQYLYIQMEYCENRTLRHAIDDDLYEDDARLWRLFREMVRGLDYIHSLNLIHRDLKPGNIFIDSHDHVKIGDFGLATVVKSASAVEKQPSNGDNMKSYASESGAMTSNVGTFFYIAPEVSGESAKSRYTTKFDMYSLGIIFFEMACILPKSGHERVDLLSKVRSSSIVLPPEFENDTYFNKKKVVKWLLNHQADERPSTTELLKSDMLPPLTTEEKKFQEKLESALDKYNSDVYLSILRNFFKSREIAQKELSFMHLNKSSNLGPKQLDFVAEHTQCVFKAHGGTWLSAPIFVPKGAFYSDKESKPVCNVVSENGNPMVCCPDVRYPFARLVAIQNLKSIRRYCIDRVHRPVKFYADFPQGKFECAFDFVGEPSEKVEFCARIMKIAQDVIKPLADTQNLNNNFTVEVAHLSLAEAIMKNCGLQKNDFADVLAIIRAGIKTECSPDDICQDLIKKGFGEKPTYALRRYLIMNDLVENVLGQIIQKGPSNKRNTSELDSKVESLRSIVKAAQTLGVEYKMNLRPLLIPVDKLYRSFMCEFFLNNAVLGGKKSRKPVIFAQGGVYNHLISQHRERLPPSQVGNKPVSAVGVSLSLDVLGVLMFPTPDAPIPARLTVQGVGCGGNSINVLVAYVGEDDGNGCRLQERVVIVTALRCHNISADFAHVVSENDLHNSVTPYLVLIQENSVRYTIKYGWSERGFWSSEKRVDPKMVVECLCSLMSSEQDNKSNVVISSPSAVGDEAIHFEIVSRKVGKQKECLRSEEQSRREREVANLLARWPGNYRGYQVFVMCLDLEKDALLQLSSLDLDSTNKNFNDSIVALKDRLQADKEVADYIERCARLIHGKISRKSSERPPCIIAYSILSDIYKRIF